MTAILLLNGNALQMGLLQAVSGAPALLAALPVGMAVDRLHRRKLMILVDLGRAVLMASIPAMLLLHRLRMSDLYVVSAAVGILTVAFDTAYQAFIPEIAGRDRLVDGNASMQFSQSVAGMAGPGTAGLLIGLLTAPLTLFIDAASFVVSAVSLATIRERREPVRRRGHGTLLTGMTEGLSFLYRHPVLRPLTLAGGGLGGCFSGFLAVYFLYLHRVAGLSPVVMGLILSAGAVGASTGALLTKGITARLGVGATIAACGTLFALAGWMVPLAAGPMWLKAPWFTIAAVLAFFAGYTGAVTGNTLRQALTPDPMLGRISATTQLVDGTLTALGALAGGALGEWIGLRGALVAASAGMSIMVVWLWLSPVRTAAEFPAPHAPAEAATL